MIDLGVWRANIGRFHLACISRFIRDRFRHIEKCSLVSACIVSVGDVYTAWICLLSCVWLLASGKYIVASAVASPFYVPENYSAQESVFVYNTEFGTSSDIHIVSTTTQMSMATPICIPVLYLAVFALSSLRIQLSGDVEENPGPKDRQDDEAENINKQRETSITQANLKQLEQSLQTKLDTILQAIDVQAVALRRQEESLKRQEDIMIKQGETLRQLGSEQELLKRTVNDLLNDVKETKQGIKTSEQVIKQVNMKQREAQDNMDRLELEIDRLESFSCRNNVRLFGIPEHEGPGKEDCAETVRQIFETFVFSTCAPDTIERAHRLGPPNPQNSSPRPIIAKFQRWADAMALMKNRQARENMNTRGIRTAQDHTKRQAAKLRELRNDGKRGYFVNGKLRFKTDSPVFSDRHVGDVTAGQPISSAEIADSPGPRDHGISGADDRGESTDIRPSTRPTTRQSTLKARGNTSTARGDRDRSANK